MQLSASRVSHAASVPKERTMLAPVASMAFEQLIRFAHCACARLWQACCTVVPDPHPCSVTIQTTAGTIALIDSFIVAVWSRADGCSVITATTLAPDPIRPQRGRPREERSNLRDDLLGGPAGFVGGRLPLGLPDGAGDNRTVPVGRLQKIDVEIARRRAHDRGAVPVVGLAKLVELSRNHLERALADEHGAALLRRFYTLRLVAIRRQVYSPTSLRRAIEPLTDNHW